jgi:hypothetical protein
MFRGSGVCNCPGRQRGTGGATRRSYPAEVFVKINGITHYLWRAVIRLILGRVWGWCGSLGRFSGCV